APPANQTRSLHDALPISAGRVHATQPGLSKQLKQLEDELGFQLFLRKGRSLEGIAPAGQQVIEHARRILSEAANIRAYAANERRSEEHTSELQSRENLVC